MRPIGKGLNPTLDAHTKVPRILGPGYEHSSLKRLFKLLMQENEQN